MREVLDWAVAAYMSSPEASDAAVADLLAGGFPRGLASRAVAFLPLAFGRRVLRELVALPDRFVGAAGEAPLASEPLFALAEALAAEAGRDKVKRIGMHSAEVHAVNSALAAGAKAADLVLSPPRLSFDGADGTSEGAAEILAATLAAHGSALPCQARLYPSELAPGRARSQLDIVVSSPSLGKRRLVESFAAFGETIHEARAGAMARFMRGSLHVLLAALDDGHGECDQVEWETWGDHRACLGPLLKQWSDPPALDFGGFLDEIKRRLLATPLSPEVHWHRTFVAVGPDRLLGHESLLDNDDWAPGLDLVTSWPWPRAEKAYALRQLVVLVPA
jgi:hypothetical protein